MELIASVKEYDWGKIGNDSLVARLAKGNNPEFVINTNTAYSELWIGTHPSGDAILKHNGESFQKYLGNNPDKLGESIVKNFDGLLPFILKVLSINKPLSIQAHPDKELAKILHNKAPHIYKDANHKPEMIVALTDFEALCGFRPLEEIKQFISNIPILHSFLDDDDKKDFLTFIEINTATLKKIFYKLINSDPNIIKKLTEELIKWFESLDISLRKRFLGDLFIKLQEHFPNDVGNFTIFFLNYIQLQTGEAVFLEPNEIHAYISGDGVECMGCSDNVVRAAFTPKYIDSEVLLDMLTYNCKSANIITPEKVDSCTYEYQALFPEFKLAKIEVSTSMNSYDIKRRNSCSLLLTIEGSGKVNGLEISPGKVYFFEPDAQMTITNVTAKVIVFQAYCDC